MSLTQPEYPLLTERTLLRPIRLEDVAAVNSYRSLPEVSRYLPHPPQDLEATAETVARLFLQRGLTTPGQWLDLGVELRAPQAPGETAFVGEVLLKWDAEWPDSGEIGFAFHPRVARTGIATEAVRRVLRMAFEDLGWRRVAGICDTRNDSSAAMLTRIGMRHEGDLRELGFYEGDSEPFSDAYYAILDREWRELNPER